MLMRADISRIAKDTISKINEAYRKEPEHEQFLIEAFSVFLLKVCQQSGSSPKNHTLNILGNVIEVDSKNYFFLDQVHFTGTNYTGSDEGASYWENRILTRQEVF